MDAHFDQVQKARQLARGGKPRNYFAYSTVLDRQAFEEWRSQHGYLEFELPEGQLAEARGLGLVFDFPSRWWGGRVAGLADAPGQRVCGRLYTLAAEDWPIVQHKEGAITGMCVEREIEVHVAGAPVRAVAFTTAPARRSLDGAVSARFVEALQRGARAAGLPEAYLEELRALAPSP
jgi:gamma-glutamylcyclotransferase